MPRLTSAPVLTGHLRSGWPPAGLLAVVIVAVLDFYGVPVATTAVFAGYLVLGIVLPGTLVWRSLHGGGMFVEDVAAGLAVGYAGEVLAYVPARAVGWPLLVLVWPLGVLAVFGAVPRLRRHWCTRQDRAARPPALWSWSVTAMVGVLVFWSVKFFRVHAMTWPGYATPDSDSPFHLALIGEAKWHMPMATPWLHGEPLYYHWFVYAEIAATSWVTGIEPQLLLLRLSALPMLIGLVVLVAVLARRLFGHWWTGVAAIAGTLLVLAPSPYAWRPGGLSAYYAFSPFEDGSSLRLQLWTSPTQTFGAVLFAPLVLVVVDLLRGASRGPRAWALLAVLLSAVMGAKATYLPLLLAALLLVVAGHAAVHRRVHDPAVGAATLTLASMLFAQAVIFGGTSQGLGWQPLETMRTADAALSTGFHVDGRPGRLALLTLLTVTCWVSMWAGLGGLVRRCSGGVGRRGLEPGVGSPAACVEPPAACAGPSAPCAGPEVALLLGIGAAGIGAVVLLGQSGGSQSYFLQSARPYLALASVGGLAALVGGMSRRRLLALVGAALTGALIVEVVRAFGAAVLPVPGGRGSAVALAWPFLAMGGATLAVVVPLWTIRRHSIGAALVVCLLAGLGMATAADHLAAVVRDGTAHGWRDAPSPSPVITRGTLEAGRWLRDHSAPDDLVATNAHCRTGNPGECVNLHFSVAAFTERRVLVESWGYTTTAHVRAGALHMWDGAVPFWRPDLLAANDAAFTAPSAATVSALRDRFGVRWLFADETQPGYDRRLPSFARWRFHAGDCTVFELR